MTDEKLPRLTEAHIRNLASESSFERGTNYYRDRAVLEPVRQEMELRALCEGSDYEPYQVSVKLAKSCIVETSCTCPYDYGFAQAESATDFIRSRLTVLIIK